MIKVSVEPSHALPLKLISIAKHLRLTCKQNFWKRERSEHCTIKRNCLFARVRSPSSSNGHTFSRKQASMSHCAMFFFVIFNFTIMAPNGAFLFDRQMSWTFIAARLCHQRDENPCENVIEMIFWNFLQFVIQCDANVSTLKNYSQEIDKADDLRLFPLLCSQTIASVRCTPYQWFPLSAHR